MPLKRFRYLFQLWAAAVTGIVAMLVLSVATYAWFTTNKTVSTDKASARSGTDTLKLLVSGTGGNDFKGSEETDIVQVNAASRTQLMPVSTADLGTFVYNPVSQGDMAESFQKVENEKYYYHGRIYLRAEAEGKPAGARMALYLDEAEEAGGALVSASAGSLLNAARLGLSFDGGHQVIFYLSDKHNASSEQARNTRLNGKLLEDGQVLQLSGGQVKGVKDPAIPLSDRRILIDDTSIKLPDEPLLYMELNRTYQADIYFYIEGCDPDCSDSISYDGADLHLAFYGILEE